jgi:hypothetical protein
MSVQVKAIEARSILTAQKWGSLQSHFQFSLNPYAGIRVHASLSPLLPCNPERLVELLKPYVDQIWIDRMRNIEVNTRPELIDKYSWFFDEDNYRATITKIAEAMPNRRSQVQTEQKTRSAIL